MTGSAEQNLGQSKMVCNATGTEIVKAGHAAGL